MAIYLSFETPIKGGATTVGYEEWIQADSMQFGVGRAISNVDGGGDRETSTPSFSEVTFSMLADIASTELLMQAIYGKELGTATIHLVNTSGEHAHKPYEIITLKNPIISNYSESTGGDRPSISFSINFTQITRKWNKFTDGGGEEEGEEKGWNLQANEPT
ncbi:MAG: type VI secretion system tube protein Hcp [Gammaproteobacteria bacterium]